MTFPSDLPERKLDKFTDRARRVLNLAQDEAQRFNHNYVGTEHLLLGLITEGEGLAATILREMNVDGAKVRTAVEFIIGRGDRPVVHQMGLTDRAKRVIGLAIEEAHRLGHNYIGTEHLLLGLVREGEGIAAGVLESLGVNLDRVRKATVDVISAGRPTAVPPAIPEEERLLGLARDHAARAEESLRLANVTEYPASVTDLLTEAAVRASLAETYMRLADVDRRHQKRVK